MQEQLNLFAASYEKPELPKKIRLIEFFAGIGAQAKALEILGADFENWRTCEWSWQSILAYNAIHHDGEKCDTSRFTYEEVLNKLDGISHDYNQPMTKENLRRRGEEWARNVLGAMLKNNNLCPNISSLTAQDLRIEDRGNYTYILTYSFPCQDLSNAGLGKGMEKGSGTRSGLLWEVERILLECKELDCLPQVLVMENVPGVISKANLNPFNQWLDALEGMGYTNYHKILNAKDYGIPQNRQRCFMVSILGEYSYHFPKKMKLKYRLKDFIKQKVDESYYLSDELVKSFEEHTQRQKAKGEHSSPNSSDTFKKVSSVREPSRVVIVNDVPSPSVGENEKPFPLEVNQSEEAELHIPSATSKGYMEAHEGDGVLPTWKGARGTVQGGATPTILTSPETIGVVVKDDRKG